jgi:hypothetical protein|tara:strand:+ start:1819 stop:2505 length:687 start_codon:yes stop_codon:yes gene_type:complete
MANEKISLLDEVRRPALELYLTALTDLTNKLSEDVNGPYADSLRAIFNDQTIPTRQYEPRLNHLERVLTHLRRLDEYVNQYIYVSSGKNFRISLGLTRKQVVDEIFDLGKQKGIKIRAQKQSLGTDLCNIEKGKISFNRHSKTFGGFSELYIKWLQNRGYDPDESYPNEQIKKKTAHFKTNKELIEDLILEGRDFKEISSQVGITTEKIEQYVRTEKLYELWEEVRKK